MKPKRDEKILAKEIERRMDREFEKMGIKTRVYHFRDAYPFNSVTVVMGPLPYTWEDVATYIKQNTATKRLYNPATQLLEMLAELYGIHGVAICDKRDSFSRLEGRCRAKRRLLRYLKKRE